MTLLTTIQLHTPKTTESILPTQEIRGETTVADEIVMIEPVEEEEDPQEDLQERADDLQDEGVETEGEEEWDAEAGV